MGKWDRLKSAPAAVDPYRTDPFRAGATAEEALAMSPRSLPLHLAAWLVATIVCPAGLRAQDAAADTLHPPRPVGPDSVPKGVQVLDRGPIHEAYAAPTAEPAPAPRVAKRPPARVEEVPPDTKPEGQAVWISGYWAWDEERKDFLWVSGIWRVPPPGKRWVAGYWRDAGDGWQWVRGFWVAANGPDSSSADMNYLPQPPAPPAVAPPGEPPIADSFYVPGYYVWQGDTYAWRAGYWAHIQPGCIWVPAHYCWTPGGYLFVPGYWDWTLSERGILYAPVAINFAVVGPAFVYTPCYCVLDPFWCDGFFVGPYCCHYYFGCYFGPRFCRLGFEHWALHAHQRHDPLFAHARWEHRNEPGWATAQVERAKARAEGHNLPAARGSAVGSVGQLSAARGSRLQALDEAGRAEARRQSEVGRQAALERRQAEVPRGASVEPHVGRLPVHPGPAGSSYLGASPEGRYAGHPGVSDPGFSQPHAPFAGSSRPYGPTGRYGASGMGGPHPAPHGGPGH
jgi:hypothetical protein